MAILKFTTSLLGSAAVLLCYAAGNRTTPPTLNVVAPLGVARGTTVEMTVEGLNLARASAIYFSEPGVTGKILRVKELPDLPDIRLGSNGTPSTVDLGRCRRAIKLPLKWRSLRKPRSGRSLSGC